MQCNFNMTYLNRCTCVHSVSSCNVYERLVCICYKFFFFPFSEQKRRLKAEQKAKEKLEKEAAALKKAPVVKKENDASAATNSADISPNVGIKK